MNEQSVTIAVSFAIGLAAFAGFVVVLLWYDGHTPHLDAREPVPAVGETPGWSFPVPARAPIPVPAIGRMRYAVIVVAFLLWSLAISDHLVRH